MKLQVLSDLHLESQAFTLKVHPDADVVVLAGDIAAWSARPRMERMIRSCPRPVIYVPGNHEAYRSSLDRVWSSECELKKHASHFHPLSQYPHQYPNPGDERDVVVVGCTLWTGFSLPFYQGGNKLGNVPAAKAIAAAGINDFHSINGFTVDECERRHVKDVGYLTHMIERYPDKKVVVVTHFLPSERSIDPLYATSPLNPYFATHLEWLMLPQVKLWIHGHTHSSHDYMVGGTRVVCNPRGYNAKENPRFNSQLVVEV